MATPSQSAERSWTDAVLHLLVIGVFSRLLFFFKLGLAGIESFKVGSLSLFSVFK